MPPTYWALFYVNSPLIPLITGKASAVKRQERYQKLGNTNSTDTDTFVLSDTDTFVLSPARFLLFTIVTASLMSSMQPSDVLAGMVYSNTNSGSEGDGAGSEYYKTNNLATHMRCAAYKKSFFDRYLHC